MTDYLPANNVYFDVFQRIRDPYLNSPNYNEACREGQLKACYWLLSDEGKARRGKTPIANFRLVLSNISCTFEPVQWRFIFRLGWDT